MRKKLLIGAFVLGATMLTSEVVPTAHVEYKVLASEAQAGNLVDVKVTPTGYHTVSLTDLTKGMIDLRENANYEYAWVDDSKNLNNTGWKPLKGAEAPEGGVVKRTKLYWMMRKKSIL